MTSIEKSADVSFYYHEDATADVASVDSSALIGNWADAMKDSIVIVPGAWLAEEVPVAPTPEDKLQPPAPSPVSTMWNARIA